MSKELDLSDLSKLSPEDLEYARQRYLITDEQAQEAGLPAVLDADADGGGSLPGFSTHSNPADFKAKEVIEYLKGLDTDTEEGAEEFDRVIEAEGGDDGEQRVSILRLAED